MPEQPTGREAPDQGDVAQQQVDPNSIVAVDAGDGTPQLWTGTQWNERLEQAQREEREVSELVIEIHTPCNQPGRWR
jgi:hypothetical protein